MPLYSSIVKKYLPVFALGLFCISLGLGLWPVGASAATDAGGFPLKDLKFSDVLRILNTFVTWIFTVFLIVAVVFVILAAFRFLVYGADPAEIKKATHALVYAAIAMAVALSSLGARSLVENILGATGSSGTPTSGTNGEDSQGKRNFGTSGLGNNVFSTKGFVGGPWTNDNRFGGVPSFNAGANLYTYPNGTTYNPTTGIYNYGDGTKATFNGNYWEVTSSAGNINCPSYCYASGGKCVGEDGSACGAVSPTQQNESPPSNRFDQFEYNYQYEYETPLE